MGNMIDQQVIYASDQEELARNQLLRLFKDCPIPGLDSLNNLGLFLSSKNLSRILFLDHIYREIIDVMGVIIEFGTRWGQNMSIFSALRGIYEPFNRHRKIVGFDTFTGFPGLSEHDNPNATLIQKGRLACTPDYDQYLEKLLVCQEQDNPVSHLRKFEIRKGDAILEIDKFLQDYPETVVALAFFDLDIYEPTIKCLQSIKDRVVKGSVLAFDELNDRDSPGETLALMEAFGLRNIRLKRYRYASRVSYFVVE